MKTVCDNCSLNVTTINLSKINNKCPRCGAGIFRDLGERLDIAPGFKGGKDGQAGKNTDVVSGGQLQSDD